MQMAKLTLAALVAVALAISARGADDTPKADAPAEKIAPPADNIPAAPVVGDTGMAPAPTVGVPTSPCANCEGGCTDCGRSCGSRSRRSIIDWLLYTPARTRPCPPSCLGHRPYPTCTPPLYVYFYKPCPSAPCPRETRCASCRLGLRQCLSWLPFRKDATCSSCETAPCADCGSATGTTPAKVVPVEIPAPAPAKEMPSAQTEVKQTAHRVDAAPPGWSYALPAFLRR